MAVAEASDYIKVDVPEGFLPQSVPVKPDERISSDDVRLETINKDDLMPIARMMHTCFPEVWWTRHEPLDIRPSDPEIRTQRLAMRLESYINHPSRVHAIKAVDASTGELMGFAGWHSPRPDGEEMLNMFALAMLAHTGKFPQTHWSQEDLDEIWRGSLILEAEKEFAMWDAPRNEEMEGTPYWYLAPFAVLEKFRGRGVGGRLMKYAIDLADRHDPPQALALEALPNARPVYMRYGFEAPKSMGVKPNRDALMIRWPKEKEKSHGDSAN